MLAGLAVVTGLATGLAVLAHMMGVVMCVAILVGLLASVGSRIVGSVIVMGSAAFLRAKGQHRAVVGGVLPAYALGRVALSELGGNVPMHEQLGTALLACAAAVAFLRMQRPDADALETAEAARAEGSSSEGSDSADSSGEDVCDLGAGAASPAKT